MTSESSARVGRIAAFDAQRGLIMLFMAIDHASMFVAGVHFSEFWGLPLPDYGSSLALFTRVVSHLCAPGFFLLMGVGMALFASSRRERGMREAVLVRHFALRGAILVVVDVFIVTPAWVLGMLGPAVSGESSPVGETPGVGGDVFLAVGVLAALGMAMMLGGLAVRFGARTNAVLGLVILIACQLLLPDAGLAQEPFPSIARLLLVAGSDGIFVVLYPVAPWFGVCLLGIAMGSATSRDSAGRPTRVLAMGRVAALGSVALLLFVVVRGLGGFGTHHPLASGGWQAWFGVTKYPPSLAFLLLSLGANAVLLWLLSRESISDSRFVRWLLVFGRAPLFFYVLHLYVYALIGLAIPGDTSLPGMYPVWLLGLVLLYPACVRYAAFKRAKANDSLWRLF
jgi:uncharacterized membrane protein